MQVPFLDLKKINQPYKNEFVKSLTDVMSSGWYIQGQQVGAFEEEFAQYCHVEHCIGVGNGLDAIKLILLAYGIGPGDEVIVPSNTFIATWLAVTQCGATIVPVEPDHITHNINTELIEAVITPRTAAIIAVHLYGQPADMDAINSIATKNNLLVIEDAAQSQGALYKGRPTGCLGHAAATSFYPGKNLGALGDGGAVLTNDLNLANRVKKIQNYGSEIRYKHELLGVNSRLDEIQASFLRIKLRNLDKANSERKKAASYYNEALKGLNIILPSSPSWSDPVWHLYVIQTTVREKLQNYLQKNGVGSLVHYPTPPHKQDCYKGMSDYELPVSEKLSKQILSLPISPILLIEEQEYVVRKIKEFYSAK